jgi:SAM-dependent methyltransferase
VDERIAANRANWDARTPVHVASRAYDVERWLADQRGPRADEAALLGPVDGKKLLHLQCHIGLETLAWARVGADVVGLDLSPAAIAEAERLAHRARLEHRARFVCADVNNAAAALTGERFDIVYVSLGALCWLPSVQRWAHQVAAVLAPGGRLFLQDSHPVSHALHDDDPVFVRSYFEEPEAVSYDDGMTYTDGPPLTDGKTSFEWNHGIGEIVSALIAEGLVLDSLVEHDWTRFGRFPWLSDDGTGRWIAPPEKPRIPLAFTLTAHLPSTA